MIPISFGELTYRPASEADIPCFVQLQMDEESRLLAAFVTPGTAEIHAAKWQQVLNDPANRVYAIDSGGGVVGRVGSFWRGSEREVTYWIDRRLWGRGIARAALAYLLTVDPTRPLFARVAADNTRSVRVLERSGFVLVGSDRDFAAARGLEIEELVYRLD
jgi:RimJ/RimL family protein N-acetyltransferase